MLAQRLIRLICPHCSQGHTPAPHENAWLTSLATQDEIAGARLRRGHGCPECNQTGYIGRTGIYEFIEMTRELVDALNHGEPATFTQAARRQMAGHTLARDALRLVLEGRATIEDAMRIGNLVEES